MFPMLNKWMKLWLNKILTQLVSTLSWKDRRHQIYILLLLILPFNVAVVKKYTFAFDVKIDHQLIISPGPLLQKLKWLFPPLAHLNIVFVLKTERMAVLKKRVCSAPKVGAAETLTPVALKHNKTIQLSWPNHQTMGLLHQLKKLWALALLSNRMPEGRTGTWTFPYCSPQSPIQASVLWSSES